MLEFSWFIVQLRQLALALRQAQRNEAQLPYLRLARALAKLPVHDVGIDAMGQRDAGYRSAKHLGLGSDLDLELRAVQTSLGGRGDRLARHRVHDLHRAHDARLSVLSQDGFAGRLQSKEGLPI